MLIFFVSTKHESVEKFIFKVKKVYRNSEGGTLTIIPSSSWALRMRYHRILGKKNITSKKLEET